MSSQKGVDEIKITYKPIETNEENVRIFGKAFVANNKDKCKIVYKDNEYDLTEYVNDIDNNYNNKDLFSIKLRGINNITTYQMFNACDLLISLDIQDISKWDTSNITDMSFMFCGCISLLYLPDISKLNTSNITDMSFMFYACKSLLSLPDISKWDTSNVINFNSIFCGCHSLSTLPNISKWNISNAKNICAMFRKCRSLTSLPDISKWNTPKLEIMIGLFGQCCSLTIIPNILIKNSNFRSLMFEECLNTLKFPKEFTNP